MWWLWIAGPLLVALLFVATDWRDKRREVELARWRRGMGARAHKVKAPGGPKSVATLPSTLRRILVAAGGGERVDAFELVPRLAYLAIMGGNLENGSDHQTVVAKLDEPAPTFCVRPLATLDGQREPNLGVQFKKDPELMDLFIVERTLEEGAHPAPTEAGDKAIRKWLSPPVRAALLDMPDAWLWVDGKTMALSRYGCVHAERLHDLVTTADIVFAEYGADGGPSLFGDEGEDAPDEGPVAKPAAKKKASVAKPA